MVKDLMMITVNRHLERARFYRNWANTGSKTFKAARMGIAIREVEEAKEIVRDIKNLKV